MSEYSELVKQLREPNAGSTYEQMLREQAAQAIERLEGALEKINGIRNSVIGAQNMNFSEHVYPLVAALEEVGYEGLSYAENRENLGTLIERAETAEQQLAEARAEIERLCLHTVPRLRIALRDARPFLDTLAGMVPTQMAKDNIDRHIKAIDEALAAPAPCKDSEGKD